MCQTASCLKRKRHRHPSSPSDHGSETTWACRELKRSRDRTTTAPGRVSLISRQKISLMMAGGSLHDRTRRPAGAREGGASCGGTERPAGRDQCRPRGAVPEPRPHSAACAIMPFASPAACISSSAAAAAVVPCSAVNYSYTGIAVEIPGCLLVLVQDWSFSRWKS